MASLLKSLDSYSKYKDRYYEGSQEGYMRDMALSSTLYVGNLSFYTTEEQIHEVFSKVGCIRRLIMGLDRNKLTPCGFCFVEYENRQDALDCMKYLNNTKVDDRVIRTDIDPGFREGRQYGRGKSGGQVRDEFRSHYDEGRGGYGSRMRGSAYEDTDVAMGASMGYGGGYGSKRRYQDEGGDHQRRPNRNYGGGRKMGGRGRHYEDE